MNTKYEYGRLGTFLLILSCPVWLLALMVAHGFREAWGDRHFVAQELRDALAWSLEPVTDRIKAALACLKGIPARIAARCAKVYAFACYAVGEVAWRVRYWLYEARYRASEATRILAKGF